MSAFTAAELRWKEKMITNAAQSSISGKQEVLLKFCGDRLRTRESHHFPPMCQQSATRIKGDDFQHLYSWFELLSLLDRSCPHDFGFVEHPTAGAADDVTLHSLSRGAPSKFVQVKFHVDQRRHYSSASLVATAPGVNHSLLYKLFCSWKKLRTSGEIPEIWLVSNWGCSHDLGKFIMDSCKLSDEFFTGGRRSEAARLRNQWRRSLGCSEQDFVQFTRALRLRLGFAGPDELREKVNDRMGRYGLRTGSDVQAIVLDSVRTWIKLGGEGKRVDRAVLQRMVRDRNLAHLKGGRLLVRASVHLR